MHQGKVIADGPTAEICDITGLHHLTMRIDSPGGQWQASLQARGVDYEIDGSTLRISTLHSDSVARELLQQPELSGLKITAARLEDTFIKLTSETGKKETAK